VEEEVEEEVGVVGAGEVEEAKQMEQMKVVVVVVEEGGDTEQGA